MFVLNRFFTANFRSPEFWVIAIALVVASVANIAANRGILSESSSWAEENHAATGAGTFIREGAILPDLMGTFRIVGERMHFVEQDSSNRAFRCLENLMLQRVHQVIGDEPNETAWIVNGKVTEFRGENFLLIETIRRTK